MAGINTVVKRKQYLWLGIVVAGAVTVIAGGLYLSDAGMK
ncbi:TPA: conjugal transfer protein TraB, partial [Salmonella enterica subsp. enterica]